LVLLEAFHWQFHPASQLVSALLDSGKLGAVVKTYSRMTTPTGSIPKSDIRWKYDLAGGALMDMTYVISSTRHYTKAGAVTDVVSASARSFPEDKRVDEAMVAEMRIGGVKSEIYADMNRANLAYVIPRVWEFPSIEIETEKATIYYYK